MKISILIPNLRLGGAETVFLNLAKEFDRLGYSVEFVLLQEKGELLTLLPDSVSVYNLNLNRIRSLLFPLKNYINQQEPDCLIIAMWPLTVLGVLANLMARAKTKVIVTDHNTYSNTPATQGYFLKKLLKKSINLLYPLAYARVSVSNGVAKDLSEIGNLKSGSISVIHNPISLNETNVGTDVWSAFTGRRILAVGSFKPQKDYINLIKAFSLVVKKIHAKLIIVGEGTQRANMESLISELGLEEHIELPGATLNPYPWYNGCDLFVLSSNHEGFGNVIVEALACGKPVVSTDCPSGPSEILENGKYGELVAVGDSKALSETIILTLAKEHDSVLLKKRAEIFSPTKIAKQYVELVFVDT